MKKKLSIIMAIVMCLSAIFSVNIFAATSLPKISSSKPIITYTIKSSGKVYAYTNNKLNKKTGGYIACSTDECKILKISGNAVQVKYPVSGGTKTAWFKRSEFTSYNISKGADSSWTQDKKITTYRRSDGKKSFGYISAGDKCYKLAEKGKYTQVVYPVSGGYKMGWVKTSQIPPDPQPAKKGLASVAAAEVGYQGRNSKGSGKGDYTKYGKWIGANGQAWCASFVSWCANRAGVSTKVVPKTAKCTTMISKSNSYHKWSKNALKSIKKNDVIFFASKANGSGSSSHVGIVYSVSGSKITVIEGNTGSDLVKKNTYTVNSSTGKITKGWSGHYFCGYISVK